MKVWLKTNLTQAQYCVKHGLSQTAFSTWKNRLRPQLKGKRQKYKNKSKYYKFTKLDDDKIELLMRYFLLGQEVKVTAKYLEISKDSVYKFYNDFRLGMVDGALNYPQLFFGVGAVLTLGPPSNLNGILQHNKALFPGLKVTEHSSKLKTNIQVIHQLLIFYTTLKWTQAEIFLMREFGFGIYYREKYAKENNLDPNIWHEDSLRNLIRKFSMTTIARSNWDLWATQRNHVPFLDNEQWAAIFLDREFASLSEKDWLNPLLHDLKWVIQQHKINDQRGTRNRYWDKFYPVRASIEEARKKLQEKHEKVKSEQNA